MPRPEGGNILQSEDVGPATTSDDSPLTSAKLYKWRDQLWCSEGGMGVQWNKNSYVKRSFVVFEHLKKGAQKQYYAMYYWKGETRNLIVSVLSGLHSLQFFSIFINYKY